MRNALHQSRVLASATCAAATAVVYLQTLSPGAGWLDSSEFAVGAHSLGIVHPPGHPLYLLLAKAATLLLPFGGIGFRVNLLSALLGVGCALLVASIVRQIVTGLRPATIGVHVCSAATGFLFAVTNACWLQSVRAEVYTLNAFLILSATWLAIRWWQQGEAAVNTETPAESEGSSDPTDGATTPSDRGAAKEEKEHPHLGTHTVFAAAITLGLGLCNHHYLVFFFLPAAFILLSLHRSGRILLTRKVGWLCLWVLLCLLSYSYLPIRANQSALVLGLSDPTTWSHFFDTLSARTFQGSVTTDSGALPLDANLALALSMFMDQLSPFGFVLGLFGLVCLLFRYRPIGIFLLLAWVGNLLTKSIMLIDPGNPDDYGYFLYGVALLSIGIGVSLCIWERARHLPSVGGVTVIVCAVLLAGQVRPGVDRSGDTTAEAFTDATLDRVAPNSILLIEFYSVFFNHWYARLIDGRRPDTALLQASFDLDRYDGKPYLARVGQLWPFLAPVLDEAKQTRLFPKRSLAELAHRYPVYLEPGLVAAYPPDRMEGVGILRRIQTSPTHDEENALKDRDFWTRFLGRLYVEGPPNLEVRRLIGWYHFVHATFALRQGLPHTGRQLLERAKTLSPESAFLPLEQLNRGLLHADARLRAAQGESIPIRWLEYDVRKAFLRHLSYPNLLQQEAP